MHFNLDNRRSDCQLFSVKVVGDRVGARTLCLPTGLLCLLAVFNVEAAAQATQIDQPSPTAPESELHRPHIAFAGLHGGIFERLQQYAGPIGLDVTFIADDQFGSRSIELGEFDVLLLQHTRSEYRKQYKALIEAGRAKNPQLRVVSISGLAERDLPELTQAGVIESDPELRAYYASTPENLRRMLIYLGIKYCGQSGSVAPPETLAMNGLFHPDHDELFPDVASWKQWYQASGRQLDNRPLVCVAVHSTHLMFQQPQVVEALVREFERQDVSTVAVMDYGEQYEKQMLELKPSLVVHTCHSSETLSFRERLDVPHTHSIFFREQPIADWQISLEGLTSSEMAFHIVGQELLGAIEPQIGAGTITGGGSDQAFTPIAERIEHLVARSLAWTKLRTASNATKRIAFIYYDREMGKAELMRGSATGMFMNAPRSMVNILSEMQSRGYQLNRVPDNEAQLLAWMTEYGRQISVWAPGVLDRMARSGQAALVPTSVYKAWFERYVPQDLQAEVVDKWGAAPGKFLVWENQGEAYIVIPRIDLGNVTLLPQPLRGEAHDTSLVHDLHVPPPHNYLATYFWIAQEFKADAMIHFGTHGSEFLLPGKPAGLSRHDWPDIVMGSIPNINPWVINNLGESSPAKRRAYALLIDHLVPPSVNAGLADELANLHSDIDKWIVLDDGFLKEKFRDSITQQVRRSGLLVDCHLSLTEDELLADSQINTVLAYLHDIHNDTTPVSLHVFGQPPRDDLLVPYLATCMGGDFLQRLSTAIEVPADENRTPGDRDKYLRGKCEEMVELIIKRKFSARDALLAIQAKVSPEQLNQAVGSDGSVNFTEQTSDTSADESPDIQTLPTWNDSFAKLEQLVTGFDQTPQELSQLMNALDGKFIAPGPGNSPDRNPAALPTGRNMVVMNPEEVPTLPSWEVGKQLIDDLLASRLKANGRYPEKIAFTLNSFATFQDYGVMESQILYLMGVRPVWNEKMLVSDVELIPLDELKRPRLDVFIAGLSYYRDMLPTRMRLIDRAVRLVADADEPAQDNLVRSHSLAAEQALKDQGVPEEVAKLQATARIFGYPLGQQGSAGYYYLVEKSGEWDTQSELMEAYLSHVRNVYTEGAWGIAAADAYNHHIQGTEIVLRSWSDRTRSPLSNKYDWYTGGSLAAAVKHLTGKQPEFLFSDVRDPNRASIVSSEDALRQDFRVRLFNRKWIEGMMREGYAGADQVAVHVSNANGWTVMRPGSVGADYWQEIVEIYIRDKKGLNIRQWFEAVNPFAYQEMNEILLETIRKGYWEPDRATLREIAQEYARSVARHGEGGGLRGGGNEKLGAFVRQVLRDIGGDEMQQLVASLDSRAAELTGVSVASRQTPANATLPGPSQDALATASDAQAAAPGEKREQEVEPPIETSIETPTESVTGRSLEPTTDELPLATAATAAVPSSTTVSRWWLWGMVVLAVLVTGGFFMRWGTPRR